jgi:hypothetical protein
LPPCDTQQGSTASVVVPPVFSTYPFSSLTEDLLRFPVSSSDTVLSSAQHTSSTQYTTSVAHTQSPSVCASSAQRTSTEKRHHATTNDTHVVMSSFDVRDMCYVIDECNEDVETTPAK